MLVAVRCRPLARNEPHSVVEAVSDAMVNVRDPAADSTDILKKARAKDRTYAFDRVFGPESSQSQVYENTVAKLVRGVVQGVNASCFAYGATGSGKTHTMLGPPEDPGIYWRALQDLWMALAETRERDRIDARVLLSYVEIYNETIRDLLVPSSDSLELREDPLRGPTIVGVTNLPVTDTESVMALLQDGNRRRTQEATAANATSSRSHAVLQVQVELRERGGTSMRVAKLSLIDLAGSERAARTKNVGRRLQEGANINRSLLALGNCINALASGTRGAYIPYRDSKLTRLLKDSLAGNCRTVMIAAVAPSEACFEETINTLKYANRAKNIKTTAKKNVLSVNYHISEYESLISDLRAEVASLKGRLGAAGTSGSPGPGQKRRLSLGIPGVPPTPAGASAEGPLSPAAAKLQALQSELLANFRERVNVQRSLIDLQATNANNEVEIAKRQVELARYEHAVSAKARPLAATAAPSKSSAGASQLHNARQAEAARREVAELRQAISMNSDAKREIQERLADVRAAGEELKAQLDQLSSSEDRHETLELQYQVAVLELENMELERSRLLHEAQAAHHAVELRKLRLRLRARDQLLHALAHDLERAGMSYLLDTSALQVLDAELGEEFGEVADDDDELDASMDLESKDDSAMSVSEPSLPSARGSAVLRASARSHLSTVQEGSPIHTMGSSNGGHSTGSGRPGARAHSPLASPGRSAVPPIAGQAAASLARSSPAASPSFSARASPSAGPRQVMAAARARRASAQNHRMAAAQGSPARAEAPSAAALRSDGSSGPARSPDKRWSPATELQRARLRARLRNRNTAQRGEVLRAVHAAVQAGQAAAAEVAHGPGKDAAVGVRRAQGVYASPPVQPKSVWRTPPSDSSQAQPGSGAAAAQRNTRASPAASDSSGRRAQAGVHVRSSGQVQPRYHAQVRASPEVARRLAAGPQRLKPSNSSDMPRRRERAPAHDARVRSVYSTVMGPTGRRSSLSSHYLRNRDVHGADGEQFK